MTNPTVTVHFFWQQTSADPRQYNQQRVLLTPEVYVAIDVPLKHEYIHNAEEIIQSQLMNEDKVLPVLTPAGMVYCDNALVAAYNEARQAEKEELEEETEDWFDESNTKSDDGWDVEFDEPDSEPDFDFDETDEEDLDDVFPELGGKNG